jgi:inner centromere protein
MTPVRKEYKTDASADNYNIDDIRSDDSTDEDTAPRKPIPEWAQGEMMPLSE